MSELLGKSPKQGRAITLLRHTLDVMDAGEWLFGIQGEPTRLGREWLRFFRIPQERFPEFHITLLASAALHDWGKANDGMQRLLIGQGKQVIRHEHLSGLLLAVESVTDWLRQRLEPVIDQDIVLSAVISHHLKVRGENLGEPIAGAGLSFRVEYDHPAFHQMLQQSAQRLGLPLQLPDFPKELHWAYRDTRGELPDGFFDIDELRQRLRDNWLDPFKKKLNKDEDRRRMLWAVRAGLIAADAAASGLRREDLPLHRWICQVFDAHRLCDKAFIWSNVIDRRIEEVKRQGRWKEWNEFQEECSDQDKVPARALLLAPCGSGKTLAAWRWIATRLEERPTARVIFLYPTRATAKEGFRDYVSWAPESDAALMHGTSAYDLEGMFANEPDDPRKDCNYEVERRLYALGYWTRRVFSATVDQFFAFLQYAYGAVCMLPALADSVVVVDEVHSFDRSMFSALKEFLKTFDLPVLCMTATLREGHQEQLVNECGLKRYNDRPGDLKTIASAARYWPRRTTETQVLAVVRQAIANEKRVLWVVNQVRRAQRAYLRCRKLNLAVPIFCYHSRFRLTDRRSRHDEVVQAFRSDSPPALAITTQVCEMSLDMDADVLVTEWCPTTSLIQRMGRCHRDRNVRKDAGDVWVYQPLDDHGRPELKPYNADDLTGIDAFLERICIEGAERGISQTSLEEALAAGPSPPQRADQLSSFSGSGPYAMSGDEQFREIEEFTVSAVLSKDVLDFVQLQGAKPPRPTEGLILPVPRRLGRDRDSRLPSYLAVAKDEHYHPLVGFCDEPIGALGGLD